MSFILTCYGPIAYCDLLTRPLNRKRPPKPVDLVPVVPSGTSAAPLAASLPSPLFPSEAVVTLDPSEGGMLDACFVGLSPSGPAPSRTLCVCTTASPCHPSCRQKFYKCFCRMRVEGGPPKPPKFARRPPAACSLPRSPSTVHIVVAPSSAAAFAASAASASCRSCKRHSSAVLVLVAYFPRCTQSHMQRGWGSAPAVAASAALPHPSTPWTSTPMDHRIPMTHTWSEGLKRRAGG